MAMSMRLRQYKHVCGYNLSSGVTHSCGCLREDYYKKPKLKHGQYGTRLYHIWDNMKRRCNNPENPGFYLYGERGITLCSEWIEFQPFYNWAIVNGYKDDLQLDRRNNDKGYSPDNCRWVTSKVNNRNKRTNRIITYNGESKLLKEWSEYLGINYSTLRKRLRTSDGNIGKSFTEPIDRGKGHARRAHK